MLGMLMRKISNSPNRRAETRVRLFRQARLLSGTNAVHVYMLDLSRGGALIHAPSPRTIGETVWLQTSGADILARVAWVKGDRAGLEFQTPLSDTQHALLTGRTRKAGLAA